MTHILNLLLVRNIYKTGSISYFTLLSLIFISATCYSQKFNPLTDPSLVVRLDDQSPFYKDSAATQLCADGDPCGYWGDLSGKGHHAKAQTGISKPVYRASSLNGRAAVDWVANVRPQNLSLGKPSELSDLQGQNFTLFVVASARSNTSNALLFAKGQGNSSIFNVGMFGGKPITYNTGNYGSTILNNTLFTYGVSYDPSVTEVGGVIRYFQNGSCRGSGIGATSKDLVYNICIGDWSKGTPYYSWNGIVYAVYMYSRTLSPSEIFQMDAFIRQRYAQTWPGGTSDKIVLWDGNSISRSDDIPRQVSTKLNIPTEAVFNLSWGAKDFKQMNKYIRDVDSIIPYLPKGKQLISVGWEMTNELGASTASQAYQSLVTYSKNVKGYGLKFVTGTCLPRCNNASFETKRLAVNDSLRADTKNINGLADDGSDAVMGTTTTACNTAFYGDGLHPTLKGDSIISPYFANAINALNASTDVVPPSTPANLSASSVSSTSFTLTWTASTDNVSVTSYEVFQNGISIGTTAYTYLNISGLTASTIYGMTVKAKDAAGNMSIVSTSLNVTTTSAPSIIKVACVGNSITAGIYPTYLGTKLGSGYAVTNLGTSGTTLKSWARYAELFALKPDIITIKLGTNNAKSTEWMIGTQSQFIKDYNALLDSINHNISPTPKIYLCLPTPAYTSGCTVYGNICGIILENEILHCIKQVAQARNLRVIDTHTPLMTHLDYFTDGVHPNNTGADSIASIINRAITGKNLVPTAVITNPVFNQNVNPGSNVTIQVNATDYDGSVSKVQFYDGTNLLGEDTTVPYSYVLSGISQGEHDIIVKAIDDKGAVNTDKVHIYGIQYQNVCDSVKRRYWLNLGGGTSVTTIDTLKTPSGTSYIKNGFKGKLDGSNTASYMNGYICPPATGNYVIWICTSDDGELWLSTDDKPANKQRVSYITSQYAGENAFFRIPTQQSIPISLQAGKKYYYEVLTKGGCCGNWIQLTWQLPNNSFENPMPINRFSTTNTVSPVTQTYELQKADELNQIKIYPNPAKDVLNLEINSNKGSKVDIRLLSIDGKEALNIKKPISDGVNSISVSTANLRSGFYFIQIVKEGNTTIQKVLIQK